MIPDIDYFYISNIFFSKATRAKKIYFMRSVICLMRSYALAGCTKITTTKITKNQFVISLKR